MMMTSSRMSSIPFISVSRASLPKPSFESDTSVYASSTNKTPPTADSRALLVFGAVSPTCSPTRSGRETSTRCPDGSMRSALKSCPIRRAIVVLPVPGAPEKIMCMEEAPSAGRPILRFSSAMVILARRLRKRSLTPCTPTMLSSCCRICDTGSLGPRPGVPGLEASPIGSKLKSSSVSVSSDSIDVVPLSATRSVCRVSTLSTRLRTARALPLLATLRGMAFWISSTRRSVEMAESTLSFRSSAIPLKISAMSVYE
mmetsp:Transcript_63678/g.156706  ORF Transcript_63678/g.156706 Transcript_63678/m.156706 type:complete len:257 (+) Transcript_63678:618-1388(+)